MTTGTIFNIQRFCTDDGPGIRTTVFLKGCPLSCQWCHNPESQKSQFEITFDKNKCVNCGACVTACKRNCHTFENQKHVFTRDLCSGCGACVDKCAADALELHGKIVTVDEVFDQVAKDKIFYETSGGGVTISGGEPLFQPKFTLELLKKCKENGIHTAIETSGFCDKDTFLDVIKYCDLVLFDVKETDDDLHKKYVGVPFKPIVENLSLMSEKGVSFIIRAPIIPTINDRPSHFSALKTLAKTLKGCLGVQIMPYHKTGSYKYDLLDRSYRCIDVLEPSKETIDFWKSQL